jgi:lysophospholipase L1-like esterase
VRNATSSSSREAARGRLRAGLLLVLLLGLAVGPPPARSGEAFRLEGGERIVFFGDSITLQGNFIQYLEVYLRTRFPDAHFELINHGISADTISGDRDQHKDWPEAHSRFDRDVAAWKPDRIFSFFGMNDGYYETPSEEHAAAFAQGMQRLIERVAEQTDAQLVILTPPPFDPYRRRAWDREALHYGASYPSLEYAEQLRQFSDWSVKRAGAALEVIDVNRALSRHLRLRRRERVSFYLSPDGIHPNPTGHWLIAQTILEAWNAPAEVSVAEIDAAGARVLAGEVAKLQVDAGGLSFTWTSRLPMPRHEKWDARSLELEEFDARFNLHRLRVLEAPAPRYALLIGGEEMGRFSSAQLARGIDMNALPASPLRDRAGQVLARVAERQTLAVRSWFNEVEAGGTGLDAHASPELKRRDAELRRLSQPMTVELRLVSLPDEG